MTKDEWKGRYIGYIVGRLASGGRLSGWTLASARAQAIDEFNALEEYDDEPERSAEEALSYWNE